MNNATLESAWVSTYPKRRENVKAWSTVGMLLLICILTDVDAVGVPTASPVVCSLNESRLMSLIGAE